MNTSEMLKKIRIKNELTQDEMAEKLFVTRQAVSRWENGETVPNIETLKIISTTFNVSINTLLGKPRKLICQCCGMPLEDDEVISREKDNSFNEEYCKWCFIDGEFVYKDMNELLDFLVGHMSNDNFSPEQARKYFSDMIPKLNYWKK
ncbi:MAG: helix-turn-helix domain-containing protein [Eubacterium sp.]|nr:helix-turn-helix domain-containing protein [Eubacterium sp.]